MIVTVARRCPLVCAFFATALALVGAVPVRGQGTDEDYRRAASVGARSADKVFRTGIRPHWDATGDAFWYRVNTGPNQHEYIRVDAKQGSRAAAFDHNAVAKALSESMKSDTHADKLPITALEFSPDGTAVTIVNAEKRWRFDPAAGTLVALEDRAESDNATASSATASRRTGDDTELHVRNATPGEVELFWLDESGERQSYGKIPANGERRQHTFEGHVWAVVDASGRELARVEANADGTSLSVTGRADQRQARPRERRDAGVRRSSRSPDGKYQYFTKDHNAFLREVATGNEIALSTGGTAEDAYGGTAYWSPDSKKLVVLQTQPAEKHTVTMVQSSPRTQLQPRLFQHDYLKPGDRIDHPRPRLFDVESRKQIPIEESLFPNPWSISELRWASDSSRFMFLYNQRGHQVLRVVAVDAATGVATALVDEQSRTFIDYAHKNFREWLDATDELIWMSERDGWNHLWLYDTKSGAVKNQITKGEFVVRRVDRVDPEARQIWFFAGGVRPGQDPYYQHLCRVNFDGTGMVVLTEGDGNHTVEFSPDRRYFLDTWSRVDQAPVTELRRSDDGGLVCALEQGDSSDLQDAGFTPPERFVAKGRDGTTDIYGVIIRPTNFEPNKKYPVIEQIYAGPQSAFVPKSWTQPGGMQSLAELGFIVVQIDGMGTSWRSKAFHDVCWKNIADAGFPDRVIWMKKAAETRPWMDLTRVGIYGGSAGGQNAMRGLLDYPEFYKVGAADCGCHDNRMDKIWWNELWMGWPVGPEYAASSNVVDAHKLQGKLLLTVGELDRNVDPASTMQVVDALVRADKDFELLVIPGADHGAGGGRYGRRRQYDFFVRNLLGVEPRSKP